MEWLFISFAIAIELVFLIYAVMRVRAQGNNIGEFETVISDAINEYALNERIQTKRECSQNIKNILIEIEYSIDQYNKSVSVRTEVLEEKFWLQYNHDDKTVSTIANLLPLIGLFFTFAGISYSVYNLGFDFSNISPSVIESNLQTLTPFLNGIKFAFIATVVGLISSLVLKIYQSVKFPGYEKTLLEIYDKLTKSVLSHLIIVDPIDKLGVALSTFGAKFNTLTDGLNSILVKFETTFKVATEGMDVVFKGFNTDLKGGIKEFDGVVREQKEFSKILLQNSKEMQSLNNTSREQIKSNSKYVDKANRLTERLDVVTDKIESMMTVVLTKSEETVSKLSEVSVNILSIPNSLVETNKLLQQNLEPITLLHTRIQHSMDKMDEAITQMEKRNTTLIEENREGLKTIKEAMTSLASSINNNTSIISDSLHKAIEYFDRLDESISLFGSTTKNIVAAVNNIMDSQIALADLFKKKIEEELIVNVQLDQIPIDLSQIENNIKSIEGKINENGNSIVGELKSGFDLLRVNIREHSIFSFFKSFFGFRKIKSSEVDSKQ